jgi:hypothetical protein
MMRTRSRRWVIVAAAAAAASVVVGCSSSRRESTATTKPDADNGPLSAVFGPTPHKAGAQLWAENCTRCHYVRPPDFYSAAQWELVVAHMRQRANLTGQEARQIVQFLKAGSGVGPE